MIPSELYSKATTCSYMTLYKENNVSCLLCAMVMSFTLLWGVKGGVLCTSYFKGHLWEDTSRILPLASVCFVNDR